MPRDLGDLTASVRRMPQAIQQGEAEGVLVATKRVTGLVRDQIRTVTGDMRLSGTRGSKKVGARYDKHFASTPDAPAMEVKNVGPLWLIERDTQPHAIYPRGLTFNLTRRGNISRRSGRRVLKIGDGFAAYADHPGTRGKHPFERGVDRGRPLVPRIIQAEVRKEMTRNWL